MPKQQVPVYMICGFLESGKTNFISPTVSYTHLTVDLVQDAEGNWVWAEDAEFPLNTSTCLLYTSRCV